MMHRPFRVLSKRGAFMGRSTRPLLRARFPLVSGRKERERERKRARVRTTLVLLFGFEFCLSLKIPPTKKGERFSRLLNSNGSEFVCVCKSSANHQRRVLSVLPIIINNTNTNTKILSMVSIDDPPMCVCLCFFRRRRQQRAYKLGKKKRSYNQVELTIEKAAATGNHAADNNERRKSSSSSAPGGGAGDKDHVLSVFEAHERPIGQDIPKDLANSALEYELRLTNGTRARCVIYLVYAEPMGETGKETLKRPTSELVVHGEGNMWLPVTRERCNKSCEGPILSAIQRFGKQGRTQPNAASAEEKKPTTQQEGDKSNWKNSKNLFISIDEASNHVRPFGPNKVKAFRLLFTIFQLECDANGHAIPNVDLSKAKFLGSGFSTPIRVFANNDVPKGAAAIEVRCSVQSNWNGWKQKPYATEEALKEAFSDLPQEKHAGGKEEKKTKKNNTTTTTSKLEKNGKVSVAKESAEEKKKRKMLAKQAKELEKDRAKRAKEVAAATAALGVNGKAAAKRKNGAATAAGGGPVAKKGKFTGIQQKRNLSQAEQVAAMQMYQPYFGDAMNATNNVSSIFSPLAPGRFPPSSAGGLRRLSDQHIAGFNLSDLNALQTPATNGKNVSPGNAGGTPPSNVMNNMYAAAYAQQQEHDAAAAIVSMGTPPDQQLHNTLGGDSTLMKGLNVDGEFISTADLPAMCTPPGGSSMLVSPPDVFLRTNPSIATTKNGNRKTANNTTTMKKSNGKNNANAATMRFGSTPASNLKPPTGSTMKNLPTLSSIGSLGSAFKQTSPNAAMNTIHGKMFSQRSSMYNTNAAATTAVGATASKRQLPFREKSIVASHRAGDREVSFAKDTIGVLDRTNTKGATTTTTRGNKNSMKKNTTTNKDNNTTKVTAALAGGRKVRGRKNSVASVGADLAPTRLHFGGVSPPMSTSHKGSSRRSGILVPMSMVLEASNEDQDAMEANNVPPAVEKPKGARLSSWFKPPEAHVNGVKAEVGRATRSASKRRKSADDYGATTNGVTRKATRGSKNANVSPLSQVLEKEGKSTIARNLRGLMGYSNKA